MTKLLDLLSAENQKCMLDSWVRSHCNVLEEYLRAWDTFEATSETLGLQHFSQLVADEKALLRGALERIRLYHRTAQGPLTDELFILIGKTFDQASHRTQVIARKATAALPARLETPKEPDLPLEPEKIRTAALQEIIGQVNELDIALTLEQAQAIFGDASTVIDNVFHYGADDTVVRGEISSMLSQYLVQRDWPTYGDNVDMDQFTTELHAAAITRGLTVTVPATITPA